MEVQLQFPSAELPDEGMTAARSGRSGRLLVTIREAAAILSLGRSTIYELIAVGKLEVVHVGRSVRVPVEALDTFVASLREGSNPERTP